MPMLASLSLGPLRFDEPWILVLLPIALVAVVWIGRSSLAGLSGWTRWASPIVRCVLMGLLIAVAAQPGCRRRADAVAVVAVVDVSRSIPLGLAEQAQRFVRAVGDDKPASDRLGLVTAAGEPFIQALPTVRGVSGAAGSLGDASTTDLASAVRLARGIIPADAAGRILLLSDGNETAGGLLDAATEAASAGVPIDVVPLPFAHDAEVIAEELTVPPAAREGEPMVVRVALHASAPARGTLYLSMNDQLVRLTEDAIGLPVRLAPGRNVIALDVPAGSSGTARFAARFEPELAGGSPRGDAVLENNTASGVTFVTGDGRLLLVRPPGPEGLAESEALIATLRDAAIGLEVITPELFPQDYAELVGYDGIVLVNQPAYAFSEQSQLDLARFVSDNGGGLVMIGGENAYGAGGWIGSPLAEALPVRLDPPQNRQLPRGALAIVLDASGSMGAPVSGTSASQLDLAIAASVAATDTLSERDLITVISFSGSFRVDVPLAENQPQVVARRIRSIGLGGGTNLFPALDAARESLADAEAGQRHIIVLSDGQTTVSGGGVPGALERLRDAGITVSTVSIGDGADDQLMRALGEGSGGRFYKVRGSSIRTELPQIFTKEAQIVRRSLIWEGDPVTPALVSAGSEPLRGIPGVPPITGYVVTADREGGVSQVTMRGPEEDPIMAQRQFGLGRVVCFMSDAGGKWATGWQAWSGYRALWEQHVRWAMRAAGSANLRVDTRREGDDAIVTVRAVDDQGEPLVGGTLRARVAGPGGESPTLDLRQTGPGVWEGRFDARAEGTFVVSVQHAVDDGGEGARGVAQAAFTRSRGDELRFARANEALLRRVADLTGGRVLSLDEAPGAALWSRDGITMPLQVGPIWMLLAAIAAGLLLLDVALRRVRLDLLAGMRWLRESLRPRAQSAGASLSALQQAREQARQRMGSSDEAPADQAVSSETPASDSPGKPSRSSQAVADAMRVAAARPPAGDRAAEPVPPARGPTPVRPPAGQPDGGEVEQSSGLDRLMAAKRRAREQRDQT
ncbi:MAG: VWA domain-containing protein [Phycisphaerales bacterium JB037]